MRSIVHIFLGASVFMMLAGCHLHTPRDFARVPVAAPDTFLGAQAEAGIWLSWEDGFNNPALHALINEALSSNLDIGMAWDRLNASRAVLGVASADQYPSLEASSDVQRLREKDGAGATTRNNITLGASLSWEVDLWRRIASQTKAAELDLEAEYALVRHTKLLIIAEVVSHYQQIQHMQQLTALVEAQTQTNAAFYQLTKLRLANGQTSALDVLQQQNQQLRTQGLRLEFERQQKRLQHSLAILLGRRPAQSHVSDLPVLRISLPSMLPSPKALIDLRPDLQASYARLRGADYRVAVAVADRFPRLNLSLSNVWGGTTLGALGDTSSLSGSAGLLAPLFDGFKRASEVTRREALVEEKLKQFRKDTLLALQEVEDALVDVASYEAQLTLKTQQRDVSTRNVELARQRYLQGDGDYLRVLDTLRSQQQEERQLIELRRARTSAIITLYKALGATWDASAKEVL